MNIIEYYNITDAYDDDCLPDPLKLKYSTKEKAIEVVVNNYKPRFDIGVAYDNIRFDGVYKNYNSTLSKFKDNYYDNVAGYYEIFLGETQHKIKEASGDGVIEFFAELFILFTEAKRAYTPEIKVAGQPYQSAKNEIQKIQEIGPFPLYKCKKYGAEYIYGIDDNMDNWYKTFRATTEKILYVCHNKLEIH